MQLSLYTDYGCRVLIYLACMKTERSSVEQVAQSFAISHNHLVKVVHGLSKLGFVETLRGRGGGIRLAQPAAQISMGEVVRKMEPNLALVECFDRETNTCPIVGICGLQSVLYQAREAFLKQLDAVSLEDIARAPRPIMKVLEARAQRE